MSPVRSERRADGCRGECVETNMFLHCRPYGDFCLLWLNSGTAKKINPVCIFFFFSFLQIVNYLNGPVKSNTVHILPVAIMCAVVTKKGLHSRYNLPSV